VVNHSEGSACDAISRYSSGRGKCQSIRSIIPGIVQDVPLKIRFDGHNLRRVNASRHYINSLEHSIEMAPHPAPATPSISAVDAGVHWIG